MTEDFVELNRSVYCAKTQEIVNVKLKQNKHEFAAGCFGRLYLLLDKTESCNDFSPVFVLKTVTITKTRDPYLEIEVLEELRGSEFITQIIYAFYTFKNSIRHMHIVTEYHENGTLHGKIYKNRQPYLDLYDYTYSGRKHEHNKEFVIPQNSVKKWTKQLFAGLSFMHNKSVMHRDIKPENLVFDSDDNLKIIDFGSAKFLQADTTSRPNVSTLIYRSPECLMGFSDYRNCADVWSAACVVAEMVSGAPLFISMGGQKYACSVIFSDFPEKQSVMDQLATIIECIGYPERVVLDELEFEHAKAIKSVLRHGSRLTNLRTRMIQLDTPFDAEHLKLEGFLLELLKHDDRMTAEAALEHDYLK